MKKDMTIFLSLFPNTRGLGYACIETPQTLVDYGVATIQPVSNEKSFARAKKLIDFFRPTVILIRDNDDPIKHRAKRVEALSAMIAAWPRGKESPAFRCGRTPKSFC